MEIIKISNVSEEMVIQKWLLL